MPRPLRGGWIRWVQCAVAGPLLAVLLGSSMLTATLVGMSSGGWSFQLAAKADPLIAWLVLVLLGLFLPTLVFRPSEVLTIWLTMLLLFTSLLFSSSAWVLIVCLGGSVVLGLVFVAVGRMHHGALVLVALGWLLAFPIGIYGAGSAGIGWAVDSFVVTDVAASHISPDGRWDLVTSERDEGALGGSTSVELRRTRWLGYIDESRELFGGDWGQVPKTRWVDATTVQIGRKQIRPFEPATAGRPGS